jgi:predicted acyltransferase
MNKTTRLTSLDFFRGFTMLLLVSGGTLQYFTRSEFDGTVLQTIFSQFNHPHYEGFRFWDLIQPFFMFIVGVAIPFSIAKRISRGYSWSRLTWHAGQRSIILIILGVTLGTGGDNFTLKFTNVLAQIGFTYFVTFLLIRTKPSVQLAVSIGLIILTEVLYRLFPMEGDQPFAMGKTFGDYINTIISPGSSGWAAFNAVPTSAHTIWGALCGQLLQSKLTDTKKLKYLIIGGIVALVLGYALTTVSPFIKKICTSSFVFASGGYAILALTLCYWIIDVKNYKKWALFGVVVGMNPIFIYLLSGTIKTFVYRFVEPWINLLFKFWTSPHFIEVFLMLLAWFVKWYICYYLYKKRLFFRI